MGFFSRVMGDGWSRPRTPSARAMSISDKSMEAYRKEEARQLDEENKGDD